jgi:hypothetical protein
MIRNSGTGVPPVSQAQDARATCYSNHDSLLRFLTFKNFSQEKLNARSTWNG